MEGKKKEREHFLLRRKKSDNFKAMLEDKHRGSAVTFILKSSDADTVSHPPSEWPVLNANPKIQNTFHLKFVAQTAR